MKSKEITRIHCFLLKTSMKNDEEWVYEFSSIEYDDGNQWTMWAIDSAIHLLPFSVAKKSLQISSYKLKVLIVMTFVDAKCYSVVSLDHHIHWSHKWRWNLFPKQKAKCLEKSEQNIFMRSNNVLSIYK